MPTPSPLLLNIQSSVNKTPGVRTTFGTGGVGQLGFSGRMAARVNRRQNRRYEVEHGNNWVSITLQVNGNLINITINKYSNGTYMITIQSMLQQPSNPITIGPLSLGQVKDYLKTNFGINY